MTEPRAWREALVDVMAREHRLRREAQREQGEAERWARRVGFAEARGLADLAAEARGRASRHSQQAQALLQSAAELHAEVERLRGSVAAGRGPGPPPASRFERRFAALEAERELEQLKHAGRGLAAAPSTPEAPQT